MAKVVAECNVAPLSRMQERVAICEDAIAQIRIKRYQMARTYFDFGGDRIPRGSLQKFLHKTGTACSVCAKGALFASWVRRHNEVGCKDAMGDVEVCEKLSGVFTGPELRQIESIYECWDSREMGLARKVVELSQSFIYSGNNFNQRLARRERVMLRSIIDNEGKWVLGDVAKRLRKLQN